MDFLFTYFQNKHQSNKGFTFTELIVVMGIILTIFAFSVANLSNTQQEAYLSSTITTFISDLKQQQIKAMTGDADGASSISDHGIYFETNSYTLFRGSSYVSTDTRNYTIPLESNIEFKDLSLPQSQLVFSKGSGEISSDITIILWNTVTQEEETVTINRYGVIASVN